MSDLIASFNRKTIISVTILRDNQIIIRVLRYNRRKKTALGVDINSQVSLYVLRIILNVLRFIGTFISCMQNYVLPFNSIFKKKLTKRYEKIWLSGPHLINFFTFSMLHNFSIIISLILHFKRLLIAKSSFSNRGRR